MGHVISAMICLCRSAFKILSFIEVLLVIIYTELNYVAPVRERTIPTERPPLVGEVSANVYGWRVSRGQSGGSV
jgi:hypothetical protein